jgi:hypothetical protein
VVCKSDGGDREHPDSSGDNSRCARDDGVVNQPFMRDDGVVCGFRRIQSETKVRKHMGRTFWWFANRTEGIVNILIPQATIQGVRGMMVWSVDSGG